MPTSPSSPVFVPRKVSVVVPVYNEESNLPALLPRLLAVLRAGLQLDAHDVRVAP